MCQKCFIVGHKTPLLPASRPARKTMKKIDHTLLLFAVILIEGYVVLSTELLAIRQTLPFVGSGTDTISIIIAAVLMPLALGYYIGGRYQHGMLKNGNFASVRKRLRLNLLIAMVILLPAMSYAFLHFFFMGLYQIGLTHRVLLTALYSALFIMPPVFLLGQTIPLTSNYFSKHKLAKITGRILFLSTIGSFLGAVFSTLVLMAFIGVNYTAALNFVLLAILITLLARRGRFSIIATVAWVLAIAAIGINSGYVLGKFDIVKNGLYNTVAVKVGDDGSRTLFLNNNNSSRLETDGGRHAYVEFAERVAIKPILESKTPKDILVIGAGAFTFGLEDYGNKYDYVDIDKTLRPVAEEYILREQLSGNKTFHPVEARAYLNKTQKKYDVIFLDAYFGMGSIPEYLVTREFFMQVRDHLKENGIVVANFVTSPNFATKFSRHIDNTFRTAFPHISRYVVGDEFGLWENDPARISNVIYMFRNEADTGTGKIYTDDKNTMFLDTPQKR